MIRQSFDSLKRSEKEKKLSHREFHEGVNIKLLKSEQKVSVAWWEDGYFKPKYTDTAVGNSVQCIAYPDIYYFPESEDASYLNIAGFNINNNEKTCYTKNVAGFVFYNFNINKNLGFTEEKSLMVE